MTTNLRYVFSLIFILTGFSALSQINVFTKVSNSNQHIELVPIDSHFDKKQNAYTIDRTTLRNSLTNAPARFQSDSGLLLEFPDHKGDMQKFQIFEASVMHPDLQARYPEIRSFVGIGINSSKYLRFSYSPYNGLNGIILNDSKTTIYQSDEENTDKVFVFEKSRERGDSTFACSTIDSFNESELDESSRIMSADATNHTFDVALSVTGEYAAYHGGTLPAVNAAINTTLTNVNAIYENDFNVTLQLIAGNDSLIYLDGGTDPYDSTDDSNYNLELANNLDLLLNDGDYDVGHLFGGIGGNGNAGCIGCVCVNGEVATFNHKGSGFTTSTVPIGPIFDVDYVAHEFGHQFGGNHTFSFSSEGGGIAQMEPGSGSTIMGYAGITGATDVQSNSDPYFHAISIQQIASHVSTRTCDDETTIVNNVPVANAGSDYTIPVGSPFELTGSGTDGDGGDVLTYCWEQFDEDNGFGGGFPDETSTNSNRPLFRSFTSTSIPSRTFPRIEDLLSGGVNSTTWERTPTVGRTADFRLTVRDNKAAGAANDFDDMIITWDATKGPFTVTSQTTPNSIVWTPATSEEITWTVNDTDLLAGATNVDISLSTDGGLTYPTTLISNTPNDGTEFITVPGIDAPYCRVRVQPTGNVFFAINTANFAIGNYSYQTVDSCTDYVFNTGGVPIQEDSGSYAGYLLSVTDSFTITDLDVNVNITHTDNGDVWYGIRGPWEAGGVNRLASGICSGSANTDLTFDDEGVLEDCVNTTDGGNVLPQDALTFADGNNSLGDWIFFITDVGVLNGNTGTWNSTTISICSNVIEPVLSIDEVANNNMFSIYPNPNNGQFNIKFNSNISNKINLEVYDLRGRAVYNQKLDNYLTRDMNVNLGDVQSGLYLVKVSDGMKQSTQKILIN